jgi:hypothetical protein
LATRFEVESLRASLTKIQAAVNEATRAVDAAQPAQASVPLIQAVQAMDSVLLQVQRANVSPAAKQTLQAILREKQDQLRQALNLALGVAVNATVVLNGTPSMDTPYMAAPGSEFRAQVTVADTGPRTIAIKAINLAGDAPMAYDTVHRLVLPQKLAGGARLATEWSVKVGKDARYTRMYEHRADPERDAIYIVDDVLRLQ